MKITRVAGPQLSLDSHFASLQTLQTLQTLQFCKMKTTIDKGFF
jgi:hypothetical protein